MTLTCGKLSPVPALPACLLNAQYHRSFSVTKSRAVGVVMSLAPIFAAGLLWRQRHLRYGGTALVKDPPQPATIRPHPNNAVGMMVPVKFSIFSPILRVGQGGVATCVRTPNPTRDVKASGSLHLGCRVATTSNPANTMRRSLSFPAIPTVSRATKSTALPRAGWPTQCQSLHRPFPG